MESITTICADPTKSGWSKSALTFQICKTLWHCKRHHICGQSELVRNVARACSLPPRVDYSLKTACLQLSLA